LRAGDRKCDAESSHGGGIVKQLRSITRPGHLLRAVGFAALLTGCAEQPTAPDIVKLGPATAGSIIKSNVVTTTTICLTPGSCKETIKTGEIREKVAGSERELRAALAIVASGNAAPSGMSGLAASELSNIHVSGRTLTLDRKRNGNVWHLELTHDSVAKGKISALRLSLNGKQLVESNAKWKDVSGVWYREHSDMTLYSGGRVAIHTDKAFTPTAVLAPDPSDKSAASLTLRAVFAPDEDPTGGACPEMLVPICEFMQSGDPLPTLDAIMQRLGGVGLKIADFFNGIFGNADNYDTAWDLAKTAQAYLQAYVEPNLVNIAEAIGSTLEGSVTKEAVQEVATLLAEWLTEWWFLFLVE
jgi:hypothetical protein